ncbi:MULTISPECIES: hypothetical protein [Propionispora]|jgi:hypothetical protein|uniref:Uncharacterized protein n=2 Tax=Propionispora TaxID=112902 RepID=A0A1H8X8J1_9FIRM|nr:MULTISPECIES: hypothetical protein [Propionispora]SEP36235.1 hypothetical protein SAMN04490178_12125 [Propionispora vibrioides]SHJ85078.1 hypothetical protein SAMN02745170_03491 [Propionispora hippei DSM 15287]
MHNFFKPAPRQTIISVTPTNQTNNAYFFLLQLRPVVNRGLKELEKDVDSKQVLIEVALISYLMGMGFDYRTACTIVKTWASDETLLEEGLLIREPY